MPSTAAAPVQESELLSDEQLACRARGGAREAFNQLVTRHERRLYRFLCRAAPNPADVEDAMQQAMVKAYLNLPRYDQRWRFSTWLYTIAMRELRSVQRRPAMRQKIVPLDHASEIAGPEARDHAKGELWALARRLLPSTQFTAMWLRYGEDLTPREIAKILGRPRVWVSVVLHRACAALRKVVEEQQALQGAGGVV